MRNYTPLIFTLVTLFTLGSCSKDSPVTSSGEVNILNISLENRYIDDDTIPASIYIMKLDFIVDDQYVIRYGLNPTIKDNIESLTITAEADLNSSYPVGSDVTDLFLTLESGPGTLYSTIDQFIIDFNADKETLNNFLELYFVNEVLESRTLYQDSSSRDYSTPIIESDGTYKFKVTVKVDSGDIFEGSISVNLKA